MTTITAKEIIDRASTILQDDTNVRWTESELLQWFNDGQREIVLHKPDGYTKNESKKLNSGTKQSISPDGIQLVSVVRNMGADGNTPGRAVTLIRMDILDTVVPNWHAEAQKTEVKHYMFDDRDPKKFYVYPPADGSTYLEMIYSASPDIVSDINDTITLDDVYSNALLDYILYRAYLKDADFAANNQRATGAYQTFLQSIGQMQQAEYQSDPRYRQGLIQNPQQGSES